MHATIVATYYIKLFRTGVNRHNGILMSVLLLVAETIIKTIAASYAKCFLQLKNKIKPKKISPWIPRIIAKFSKKEKKIIQE